MNCSQMDTAQSMRKIDVARSGGRECSSRKKLREDLRAAYPLSYQFGMWAESRVLKKQLEQNLAQLPIQVSDSIVDLVREIPSDIKVVSFDFFDTLASRRNVSPERVLFQSSRFLADKICQMGWIVSSEYVYRVRQAVEKTERENSVRKRFRDPEARLKNIIAHVLRTIVGEVPKSCLEDAIHYEVALELSVLKPVDGALEALAVAVSSGRRVVITSEMYLHYDHIKKFSDTFGFRKYVERIFVSSEIGLMKGSGRIYEYVAQAMGVQPSAVLHIGDNVRADIVPALEKGVFARLVDVEQVRHEHLLFDRAIGRFEHNLESKACADLILHRLNLAPECWVEAGDSDLAASLNKNVAPAFCSFVHQVAEHVARSGARRIYFLAREGLVLKEGFDRFVSASPYFRRLLGGCETKALYISRRTALALEYPACWDAAEFVRLTMARTSNLSLESVLRAWGLTSDAVSTLAVEEYETMQACFPRSSMHASMLAMLEASTYFRRDVDVVLSHRRANTRAYLMQEGFFEQKRVAVVDMGWVGTISRCLSYLANCEGQKLSMATYLFATSPAHFLEQGIDPTALTGPPGLVIDGGRDPLLFQRITDCASILEVIFGDDRIGTTIDYEFDSSKYRPIFFQQQRVSANEIVQATARAVFVRAIEKYAVAVDSACLDPAALKQNYVQRLLDFLRFPLRDDVLPFTSCALDMGVGHEGREPISLIQKLRITRLLSKDFLIADRPYLWRRGSFSFSRFPKWVFHLYENVFLLQIEFPSINRVLRRVVRWDPFIW